MRLGLGALSLTAFSAVSVGCVGEIGDPPESTSEAEGPVCTGEIMPGKSPIRRLTKFEYNNTIRDLLGDASNPANAFPAEEEPLGFTNDSTSLNVTPVLAEKYMLVAEGIAARATDDPYMLTQCPESDDRAELDACALSFIETFGRRAFRRTLTDEERDELVAIYDESWEIYSELPDPTETSFAEGIAMVIEAALQSPAFLYRVELGEGLTPVDPEGTILPLTSLEMASRLSYFLWGSMPDEELLALAEADQLRTKEQIAVQARKMLEDDKAREAVAIFHEQWLDFDRVSNVTKDPELFPEWSPAIAELMKEEMRTFVEKVIFDDTGTFQTLLTAPYTYANADLASFYGASAEDDMFERVDFPKEEHAGLLSMGAMLSYYAHTNQTSPVHRGKVVREAFLCDMLNPPPPEVTFELPEPSPDATTRERFSEHSSNPACYGCHILMDPLGFGFENYDAVGRYRTMESGQTIDASGTITDSDVNGTFVGVRELAETLASSDEVKACYAKMWFRFTAGRGETKKDACSLEQVGEAFEASGGNVKELLVALTQTDAFFYRFAGVNDPDTAGSPAANGAEE